MQVRKNEGTPQQRKGNVIMKEEKSHHQVIFTAQWTHCVNYPCDFNF